jgi:glycosyltransferase involved in cell wall biosynthesis/GT2 family glycosyltransferase
MTLDVVVVTYRSADCLAACLESVPLDGSSIVVVDNASGDEGPTIARAHGCRVIENADNRGFAAAANQAARTGVADAILFLNPDARLRPGALDALSRRLDDPDVAVVGATLLNPDGSPQRSRWPYPSAGRMWAEAFGLHRLRSGSAGAEGFVVGACLLVRRSAFEARGGFDERYWLYGEEADLCARVERSGFRVELADDAVVEHDGGASGRDISELVGAHFARGSDRFVLDHGGRAALLSYRLAGLTAAALRYPLLRLWPSARSRAAVRARQVRRTARSLVGHPVSVPDHRVAAVEAQIVVLSLEPWDEVWRRNQFLVRELLQLQPGLRVLWVEPPSDVLYELVRTRRLPKPGGPAIRRLASDPRVLLFRPRKLLPRSIYPWVDQSLSRQVRQVARRAGFSRAALWVNDSAYLPLVKASPSRTVYDITDDWLDASVAPRQRRRMERRERELVAVADEVIVCSRQLEQRRSKLRPVHLVPNAVDSAHMQASQDRPADLPPAPTAVYVGSLHDDRLDVELVAETAAALPDVSIVLVGPDSLSKGSRETLHAVANVHRLGPRPYESVPAYLQHADVVIVPHRVTPFTESLDPIKAYECLAAGRPTLATPVAGFRELAGSLTIVDRSVFAARLGELLHEPGPAAPLVEVPSWRERALHFAAIVAGDVRPGPERRFRVVYLGHTAVASGGELALARLLPGLPNVDANVVLGEDGPIAEKLRAAGVTVEVLPIADAARSVKRHAVVPGRLPFGAIVATASYTRRLARRLRELQPDVVHTNTLKSAIYGGIAARLAGIPVVWHIRDRIAPDYLPRFAVLAIRALAHVVPDAILTNSTATQRTLGATRRMIAVTPSPVVYDPVEAGGVSRPGDGPLVVGMIGRLAPWKGQDVFVRAFAEAFRSGPELAIVVGGALFGEDEYAASLAKLVDSLGLADRVELTGHVDDVPAQLARMHVVVHASVIPEPFGQVVVEAMAAGKAVIASAAGGPTEIVNDGVDGFLVAPGDVDALAAVLRRLAGDDALRERLGQAARLTVGRFSAERIGREVERVYRRVARPSPR